MNHLQLARIRIARTRAELTRKRTPKQPTPKPISDPAGVLCEVAGCTRLTFRDGRCYGHADHGPAFTVIGPVPPATVEGMGKVWRRVK